MLKGVPPLGSYNYITLHCTGLSATAGLSCLHVRTISSVIYSLSK